MIGLKDNLRTFTELDSDLQRALDLFIPGFVAFRRQVQIEGSLVFYILSQGPLGEIGRIELVKRDNAKSGISTQNTSDPLEEDILRFLLVWKKEEHTEALAMLTERARARHSQSEADYRSISTLNSLSSRELNDHINQAIQIAELAKAELTNQRQVQLWAVVSIVLNRLNAETDWEIEQDRFSSSAAPSTFLSIIERATRAVTKQGEPIEIARIPRTDTDRQSVVAVLFRPEMRAHGVGAIISAKPLDDGTTAVVLKANEATWNMLPAAWPKLRVELQHREPVEPVEIQTPVVVGEPNQPLHQAAEPMGSGIAAVSPVGTSLGESVEGISTPALPLPDLTAKVTAAEAPVRKRKGGGQKPQRKDVYVPKKPIKLQRWKDAWKVICTTREEYARGWDDSTREKPDPSYRDLMDAIKEKMHWSPGEKTIQRILRAGEAKLLD